MLCASRSVLGKRMPTFAHRFNIFASLQSTCEEYRKYRNVSRTLTGRKYKAQTIGGNISGMYSFWSVVNVSLFWSMLFECERVRVRVRMRVWVCECVSVPVRYVSCVHARQ